MRVIYPIASIIGALGLNICINQFENDEGSVHKLWRTAHKTITLALICLLIVQYFSYNRLYIDRYRMNYADELRSNYIGQAILDYQNNTGNMVTKIAIYNDANITYPNYPHLYGSLSISSFNISWSDVYALNYYLGTNYQKIDSEESLVEYFSSRDWHRLSQDQLIFDGDTLHLCIF